MIDLSSLSNCTVCARNCGVDRINGNIGFCKSVATVKVAKAYGHMWEEPCISGTKGSGTVFFSNCNLRCVFCQNHDISQADIGKEISIERLSEIFLEQQAKGYHNINLVNPTHYIPQIIAALDIAKGQGLHIPIVYNSNGYENLESIKALKGYVDVYIPDLKYFNDKYAIKYSAAPNYFNIASKVIEEMVLQIGDTIFNNTGLMLTGVIIRHLMLPGLLFDSKKIVEYIYKTFGDRVFLSLMNQYTPMFRASKYPEINKALNPGHYDSLIAHCVDLGYKNAFIQESGSNSTIYVPNFNLQGI
ncbi:MAG: radical SAM protein [Clostridium sp.]|uniref:radical SAM protein n=1 Tax=Clostridium sp. TaxID=1506 RepID=UPI00305CBF06